MTEQITSSPAEFLQGHGLSERLSLPVFAVAIALLLTACSEPEMRLAGERIDVLPKQVIETADAGAFAEGAGLGVVVNITSAPVVGLNAGHAGGNPRLEAPLTKIWSAKIGGKASRITDLATPVAGDGRVFTVAPNGKVSEYSTIARNRRW